MRFVPLGILLAYALGAWGAHASDAPTSSAALISASCTGCHTTQQDSDHSVPNLEGYSAEDIRTALIAFRDDENATVMNRIARGYTDADIEQIAAYLGTAP